MRDKGFVAMTQNANDLAMEKSWLTLLVDDHRYMRGLVRGMLAQMGIKQLEEFDECESCLKRLRQEGGITPALIILDWHMTGMDGYSFCNEVRRDKELRSLSIPIIMVTGETDPLLLEQMHDLGVKAILNKPIALANLQAAIYKAVGIMPPMIKS